MTLLPIKPGHNPLHNDLIWTMFVYYTLGAYVIL